MRCCGGGMGGWMGGWMFLASLVFLVLLILSGVLVWALIKREGKPTRPSPPLPEAYDILEQRYARGEIDLQEFEERRQALRSQGSGPDEVPDPTNSTSAVFSSTGSPMGRLAKQLSVPQQDAVPAWRRRGETSLTTGQRCSARGVLGGGCRHPPMARGGCRHSALARPRQTASADRRSRRCGTCDGGLRRGLDPPSGGGRRRPCSHCGPRHSGSAPRLGPQGHG
jgi:putative membrane protein